MAHPMTRTEFDILWAAPKSVVTDVVFKSKPSYGNVWVAENVEVVGDGCNGLHVCLTYDCVTQSLQCNFTYPPIGLAIHRYCVGATLHGDAGRYHQHHLLTASCPRKQLPSVTRRDDLCKKTAKELWNVICEESNITHTETFFEPEIKC